MSDFTAVITHFPPVPTSIQNLEKQPQATPTDTLSLTIIIRLLTNIRSNRSSASDSIYSHTFLHKVVCLLCVTFVHKVLKLYDGLR